MVIKTIGVYFGIGTTLYNWTKCFSKPVADGDMQGWHYNGGINMGGNPFFTISWR